MSDSPPLSSWDSSSLRVGLLVIGRKRKGFDMDWGREIEAAVWAAAESLPLTAVRPQTRVVDDTTLRAAVDELRQAACDTIIVLQPIMGDGRLAPILAQLWRAPIVLWATAGKMIAAANIRRIWMKFLVRVRACMASSFLARLSSCTGSNVNGPKHGFLLEAGGSLLCHP